MTLEYITLVAHAATGEAGALCFLWVAAELLARSGAVRRIRALATAGCALLLASWVTGGHYCLVRYGPVIKRVVEAGAAPWVHGVVMETKEHVSIIVYVLAVCTTLLVWGRSESDPTRDRRLALLCGAVVALAFAMAGLGVIISMAVRIELEGGA